MTSTAGECGVVMSTPRVRRIKSVTTSANCVGIEGLYQCGHVCNVICMQQEVDIHIPGLPDIYSPTVRTVIMIKLGKRPGRLMLQPSLVRGTEDEIFSDTLSGLKVFHKISFWQRETESPRLGTGANREGGNCRR